MKSLIRVIESFAIILVIFFSFVACSVDKPLSNGMMSKEVEELLEDGKLYYENGDYETALKCFEQIPSDSKSYKEAQSMMKKTQDSFKASILEKVDSSIQEGDYKSAIEQLNSAIEKIGQDEGIIAKLDVCTENYISAAVNEAKEQYIEYNYESLLKAEEILGSALKVLTNNEKLLEELSYYKEKEPIKLLDLEVDPLLSHTVSTHSFEYVGTKTDIAGVEFDSAIAPSGWYENYHPYGWSETYSLGRYSWLLDYQYTKITGVVFISGEYKNASLNIELTITPDVGSTSTYNLTNEYGTKSFEANLTGAKTVEVSLKQSDIKGTYAYIANVYVWK